MTRSSSKARPPVKKPLLAPIGDAALKPVLPKQQLVRQTRDLSKLRGIAMRLARHLEKMMPEKEDEKPRGRTDETEAGIVKSAETGTAPETGKPSEADKPLSPRYERLLGRSEGIIASFDTLVHLVIRLLEKEREPREPSQDPFAFTESDEQELDRRIVAELDRLASQRPTQGSAG